MAKKIGRPTTTVENLDRASLKQYLKDNGYQLSRVSEDLGYQDNYLADVLRSNSRKSIYRPAYKYLCNMLKVSEDRFILKEQPKPVAEKKEPTTPTVINNGLTPEQFNALLQAISNLGDVIGKGLEKISSTQSANAVIQGKIYSELSDLSDALGVTKTKPQTETKPTVTVKPQYANTFGGKK